MRRERRLPNTRSSKAYGARYRSKRSLIHAWAETSHDITYHRPESEGFGQKAMSSIEARLNKIMDEYLLPAGYEFSKSTA